jgi:aflatoxin B1 aldehyde reductase
VVELDEFNSVLDYFQSQGYNEVDTARLYQSGKQEEHTAKAGWKQRGLTLATKHFPTSPGEHSPDKLKAALTASLAALQTDNVDIFYLHAADRSMCFIICLSCSPADTV